ncbi:phosphatase PAP2 family protein [Halostella pelagica]|uniref:phosphatase PAP2 family protein n=1 Tax=Halostella pelagica TaxID=2583824 RepID=UPI001081319D|nr:phosphatase PAP2 family protein [Halostella pelagica]
MSRGVGAVEILRDIFPEPVTAAFALLTQLGDVWLYVVILTLLYWYGNRERAMRIVGVAIGAIALTLALKYAFALPRPPADPPALPGSVPAVLEPLYEETVSADGYGFPSGHAVGSAAVWGALALWTDIGTRRQRFLAAAALVAVISVSRLVLGVHYLVDVVAGVAVGGAYLAAVAVAVSRATDGPTVALGAAAAVAALGIAVSGANQELLAAFGAAVGALVAWRLADVPAEPWPRTTVGLGYALGCVIALELLVLAWLLVPLPDSAVVVLSSLSLGSVVAAPAGVRRVKERNARTAQQ